MEINESFNTTLELNLDAPLASLQRLAHRLSDEYVLSKDTKAKPILLANLLEDEKIIISAYRQFSTDTQDEVLLSYSSEWLLDNFFVVQRAIRQVREDLPLGYYKNLPKLQNEAWAGIPRSYAIASELIKQCNYQLDIELIVGLLWAFQANVPLTTGELWAFPIMLRLGILNGLAQILDQSLKAQLLPTLMVDDTVVRFCITSLRMLATQDWKVFFESVSRVEKQLRLDPSDVYTSMDFSTRNQYRSIIERFAKVAKVSEEDVAKQVLSLANEAPASSRERHVGYYLMGDGFAQLEAQFKYRASGITALRRWSLSQPTNTYFVSMALFTLFFMVLLVGGMASISSSPLSLLWVGLLAILPSSAIASTLLNWVISNNVQPRILPRFDFPDGIPSIYQTMVVIPTLITDAVEIDSLLQQLELHYLRNADPSLYFALLTDFADAPTQQTDTDDTLIQRISAGIIALNAKYGRGFYLFHRERRWNEMQGTWMGWERKRGKLVEFNHLLRGDNGTSYRVQGGDLSVLPHIKYVITLDADTILPDNGACRLIATLAHPLNRAEYDAKLGKVVSGYSILQPRVEIKPTSANQTRFTQIFAGDIGLDLYTHAVSDVYQDLFAEGSYVGKGIYDVDVMEMCLANRIPDNTLLSHDLFEGIHAHVALVSDITMLEEYPSRYLAYTRRLHRWIRGDWQLLPWLLPRIPTGQDGQTLPNTFSLLDRWKMFDNLRRSLVNPTLLLLLIVAWLGGIVSPLYWTMVTVATLGLSLLLSLFNGLRFKQPTESLVHVIRSRNIDALRLVFALIFLPYEALLALSAVMTTLMRLFVTRTRLLQWTTAAQTAQFFKTGRASESTWREMAIVPIMASGLALLINALNPSALPFALPILGLWFLSPQIAYWISLPHVHAEPPLSSEQKSALRHLARQTWLFFEQLVGPQDHWLPPDHFQHAPRLIAHRTSPTNIGLLLTSTLAAYDLGYIGLMDLVTRLKSTFETLHHLEHYRGHLLNWYDTESLLPLEPRYVSTVDSGNLAGCLIVVEQACRAFPEALVIRPQRWQGLLDTLGLLEECLECTYHDRIDESLVLLQDFVISLREKIQTAPEFPEQWATLILELNEESWQELSRRIVAVFGLENVTLTSEMLSDLRITSERVRHNLTSMQRDIELLLPWLLFVSQPPTLFVQEDAPSPIKTAWQAFLQALPSSPRLGELIAICENIDLHLIELEAQLQTVHRPEQDIKEAQAWCAQLRGRLAITQTEVDTLLMGYQWLVTQAETSFQEMDFEFLFHEQRKLFHIGYSVMNDKLDDNFYDLLASEARLASVLAIAKREVPPTHWVQLGRPITRVNGTLSLLSWSGTMFEYLMPTLFLHLYEQTFLTQSCYSAVDEQIAYARTKKVPWGISESSYYAFDNNMTYQYHAFGLPSLGLKRGLSDDLVISPYASLLALSLRPQAVYNNMTELDAMEMRGLYGFYEAVDYTESRLPLRQTYAIVQSYMAHHQGMILASITNYLLGDVMSYRFHNDPRIKSFDLLLQEKIPARVPVEKPHPAEIPSARISSHVTIAPWRVSDDTFVPQVHSLSNGRYSTIITNAGSGYSLWNGIALTRWEADTTLDNCGLWIYVQDRKRGNLWSAGYQPTAIPRDYQHVSFYPHQAEFQRRDHDITVNMQVTVATKDDVEIRQINLINHSHEPRSLRVTSYGEVSLASLSERHPAFNKLFIESEYLPENNMLLFHRRLRANEASVYLGHLLITPPHIPTTGAYEGDRYPFIGRGRTTRSPLIFEKAGELSKTIGTTFDPIMALAQDIELPPYGRVSIAYLTLVTQTRDEAIILADRYKSWTVTERAVEMARRQNELALHQYKLDTPELAQMQQILSLLLYPHAGLRASADVISANTKGQSGLWAYGISGDLPILLVRVGEIEEIPLVLEALRAHLYWREQEVSVDLVILNLQDSGYSQELQSQLHRTITRLNSSHWIGRRGGIFMINADRMDVTDSRLLHTVARVILEGKKGTLASQMPSLSAGRVSLPDFTPLSSNLEPEETPPLLRPTDLAFDNGWGGFSADGKAYVIYLAHNQWTPAPWVNVIANEKFGFVVSESGAGYTWAENSSENRLTTWRNDPVSDMPSEAMYLRDEQTAVVWSPMPSPSRDEHPYLIRHGAGYSQFEHHSQGLKQTTQLFVAPDAPVKIIRLRLENTWNRARRITVTYYVEWVLGVSRSASQTTIVPEYDHGRGALLARNAYNAEFGERVAFLVASKLPHGITTDRTEFLGRMGGFSQPAALKRIGLSSRVEAGVDPCGVIQIHIDLPVGGSEDVFFLLGEGANKEHALQLIQDYQSLEKVEATWQAVNVFWDGVLGTIGVKTPDPAMDILLNRWLLYQTLSCRIWGRSGFYQSSGAFGFRDQLQDVMALVWSAPKIAREHIVYAASHQFSTGDVLHWWHPPSGRGVKTRFSDDLLWLPFVVTHYIEATGDTAILDERVTFLQGEPLKQGEEERYGYYPSTTETFSLYEHCLRAIKKGSTVGVHGLPLMGTGDWNDGMSSVGSEGRGESVWLGWFLYSVLTRFAPLSHNRGDFEQSVTYQQHATHLKTNIEKEGWDGQWYRRAYYDDGSPLGSEQSIECQIDSIAQSWAVLSNGGDPSRSLQAMSAVVEHLVKPEEQLLLLFKPPFDKTHHNPGYVKSYPKGVRENGGQYTHAALWVVWAFAQLGQGNLAGELFQLINPILHSDTPEKAPIYRIEPYVVAADVYSVAPYVGRGGWSWYTGSASWMYRLGIEAILGLKRTGNQMTINPCIPDHWTGYDITYREGETVYHIHVDNSQGVSGGVVNLRFDGETLSETYFVLENDGKTHEVHITLGHKS